MLMTEFTLSSESPSAHTPSLQHLNEVKVNHLLDYLNKATLNAAEVASAASTGGCIAPDALLPDEDWGLVGPSRVERPLPFPGSGYDPGSSCGHTSPSETQSTVVASHRSAPTPHHQPSLKRKSAAPTSQSSIQNVFLELKDKMDHLRYEKEMLQQEKDLLIEGMAAMKEKERETRKHCAAHAEEEIATFRKELDKEMKDQRKQIRKLQQEKETMERELEQVSRALRIEVQNREEERVRLENSHATALSLLQSKLVTKERAEREKWREQEAKKIKASTLQSLEPDIVMLLQRHKAEKARMEAEFTAALQDREKAMKCLKEDVERRMREVEENALKQIKEKELLLLGEAVKEKEEASFSQQQAIAEAVADVKQTCEKEFSVLLRDAQARYEDQQRSERQQYETQISQLGLEIQRLRSQFSSDLLHATQVMEQEEKVRRLHWQEAFEKQKHEELTIQYSREAQQKIREAEVTLQEKYAKERDAGVSSVVAVLQKEHEAEEEKRNRERAKEKEQMLFTQRELQRVQNEREEYRQQLVQARGERDVIQLQLKTAEDLNKQYEAQNAVRQQEVEQQQKLHGRFVEVELEHQKQTLLTHHSQTVALMEAQFKERERQMQQQIDLLVEEKRVLEQQHHGELRKIQERVVETVSAKDEALNELKRRAIALEQTLREREAAWGAQQQLLLEA